MGLVGFILSLTVGVSSNLQHVRRWDPSTASQSRGGIGFGVTCACISSLACLFGSLTSHRMMRAVPNPDYSIVGSCVLIAIGIWVILQTIYTTPRAVAKMPVHFDFDQMIFVAMTEVMANLSLGLASGFIGLNSVLISISVGLSELALCVFPRCIQRLTTQSRYLQSAITLSGTLLIIAGLIL